MNNNEETLLTTSRFRVVRVEKEDFPPRDVIRHPGAVVILPMVDDHHVCLIRNYRLSVDATLLELPAGTRDPGEEPLETATRELAEETGYQASHMNQLHSFFLSPGILDEKMHMFLATGLREGITNHQPDERIQNHVVHWDEAMAMVDSGQIVDAKTMVALLFYERLRQRVC